MLKKTLILIWLCVAFTGRVSADEPLKTWSPKSRLRSGTAMLASPEPSATWQSMATRFGPRFPDKNDPIPYCALDNAPKIIRSEGLQGSAPGDKSSHKKWSEQNRGIAAGVRVA